MSIAPRAEKCTSPSSCRDGQSKFGQYSMPRSSPATSSVSRVAQRGGDIWFWRILRIASIRHRTDHLRDDVARPLHLHDVAFTQILSRDEVEVVQRRHLNRRAAYFHRLEDGEWVH